MAGDDVIHGNIMSDSSGFRMAKIVEWRHAKYGKLDVRDYAKLHVSQVEHGKICAASSHPWKGQRLTIPAPDD